VKYENGKPIALYIYQLKALIAYLGKSVLHHTHCGIFVACLAIYMIFKKIVLNFKILIAHFPCQYSR